MPIRPQPHFPEPVSKHYWDGVKEGELRYQTCNSCNTVNFYPTAHCQNCGSGSQTWKVSKGEGTVYTFSVVMQNRIPGFQELGAYAVAYVDLDEGFRMLTNVVVDGESALLVPSEDSSALANAVLKILQSPSLAKSLVEAGFEKVKNQFSLDAMVAKTLNLYRELLEKHDAHASS